MPVSTGPISEPENRRKRAIRAARSRTGIDYHVRKIADSASDASDVAAWASEVAASLPPLDEPDIISLGHLAAALDARRRPDDSGEAA